MLLGGCGGPRRTPGPVLQADSGLRGLSTAIRTFDVARKQVIAATGDVIAAALALDYADDACAAGATDAAAAARAKARAAKPKGEQALSALPAKLASYEKALSSLAAAEKRATSLTADQRTALDAVVTAGRAEARASDAFRVAGKAAWPAYLTLDATQSFWLDQRMSGNYRNVQDAANGYAVLTRDDRPALERARTLLERVDAARRPISDRVRAALVTADEALAPLRSPG